MFELITFLRQRRLRCTFFIYVLNFFTLISGSDHHVNARVRVIGIQLLLQHPPNDLFALSKTLKSNENDLTG